MKFVNCVSESKASNQLGRTLMHEHLFRQSKMPVPTALKHLWTPQQMNVDETFAF